ncbi:MAG TPA: glycosyltransferase family 4 protein [Solirubrobacteraceae bacterium]|jgi:UDP-glucose:(heptosyl)LPS alpha-1,3-glucosyltransferase|nr:glycosyltransferase family 4 protein [Solirubrobacteraceae bacterium]
MRLEPANAPADPVPAAAVETTATPATAQARKAAGEVTLVAHHVGAVGGMERQLAELALGLRRAGDNVTVIAHECALPTDSGVVFHRVRGPSRPFLLGYPWFMVFGSLAVRRWRRGVLQVTGAIVLNRADVVAVHYCHQVGSITPSRNGWLFRAHVKAMAAISRLGERLIFARNTTARFVCVSNGVAEEIRDSHPRVRDRVLTIYNGVDTTAFAPGAHRRAAHELRARLGIPGNRLVAVFVGSEWKRKGLAAAIEALASAPGWELVVAGAGDRASYGARAEALGVGEAVHWLGEVSDVEAVYEMADAMVLPSSYETFSLVTFEAAASGLAVLATPVNGVRELIEDARNGFLITQEPAVIAERLRQLSADPALRARLGEAARESALSFTWERMVREHDELYARMASAGPSGPVR